MSRLLPEENLDGAEKRRVDSHVDEYHARDPQCADAVYWFGESSGRGAADYGGVRHRTGKVGQAHGRFPLVSTSGFRLARASGMEPKFTSLIHIAPCRPMRLP